MTIVTIWQPIWEPQQRSSGISQRRGETIVVPPFKSVLFHNGWWKIPLPKIKKPLEAKSKKIIPTVRKRIFSEELNISNIEMIFNYLSTISLISLSTPTFLCVLELDFCSHFVLPYPREHVPRWKSAFLGIHCILLSVQLQTSSCSWFSPWIYDTSVFMHIKELSRLVHGHLLIGFTSVVYLTGINVSYTLLSSLLFWVPWEIHPLLDSF